MKSIRLEAFLLFIVIAFVQCDRSSENVTNSELYILPLGDSRVEGNRPMHESYRYELWKLLVDDYRHFDIIGNRHDDGEYPNYHNLEFDLDHQGMGGAQTSDILNSVKALDSENMPNVVLLGIGGNDLAYGTETVTTVVANINEIIDVLQEKNPEVAIFLEQIAPGSASFMNEQRWNVFNQFKATIPQIASEQTNANSIVVVVNMTENWSEDYFADNVHYNMLGAYEVAKKYFDAINMYIGR